MPRYGHVLSLLRQAILFLLALALLIFAIRRGFSEVYNGVHFGYVHNKFGRKVYYDRDPIDSILFAWYFIIYLAGSIEFSLVLLATPFFVYFLITGYRREKALLAEGKFAPFRTPRFVDEADSGGLSNSARGRVMEE